jgi:hypothetical protein
MAVIVLNHPAPGNRITGGGENRFLAIGAR